MTQPQQDPAADVGAALARLAEQTTGLQRQVTRIEDVSREQDRVFRDLLREAETRIRELTDAKFVTYETLITSQAEKVALALDATEKAIGKAEVATSKAIDKAEVANADRFAAVNEFRGQLSDQVATFMPRSEHGVEMSACAERIGRVDELVKTMQIWQGNITGRIAILGAVFAVLMTVIAFAASYATRP